MNWFTQVIIVCKNSLYKLFLLSPKKMPLKIFGFSIFNMKNGYISTLVSSYGVAASFITSKLPEHNTENKEFAKSLVLQKCPLTHITLIIIIIMIIIIIIIIIMIIIIIITIIKSLFNVVTELHVLTNWPR